MSGIEVDIIVYLNAFAECLASVYLDTACQGITEMSINITSHVKVALTLICCQCHGTLTKYTNDSHPGAPSRSPKCSIKLLFQSRLPASGHIVVHIYYLNTQLELDECLYHVTGSPGYITYNVCRANFATIALAMDN